MLPVHLLDPDHLVHHEHPRCWLIPEIDPFGKVKHLCENHSFIEESNFKAGIVTNARTCIRSHDVGLVLLTMVCPGCPEHQVVKIAGMGVPRQVSRFPNRYYKPFNQVYVHPNPFKGDLPIYCCRCRDDESVEGESRMLAVAWRNEPKGERRIEVLLQCCKCRNTMIINFWSMLDVGTGVCDHRTHHVVGHTQSHPGHL